MKILILCTGNSCRSQMAHGFLQTFDKNLTVCSAGTEASGKLNQKAVAVMKEIGIDISHHTSDSVDLYLDQEWDYVITVCGGANENCPAFLGKVKHRLHIGFDDPSHTTGTEEFIWSEFRRVRDEIRNEFYKFYVENIKNNFMNQENLKNIVKEKYSEIAKQQNETSCCGSSACCGELEFSMIGDEYKDIAGYNPDADLGLGCGLPTEFAHIKPGDTVVDLGSGAGNDCFVARQIAGETGKIIGIDFTEAMIEKARENAEKLGFNNVEFRLGDIEKTPMTANKADVVISNCVLNLVPDKEKAFDEIYRILKSGGHLSVSDVVIEGNLPEGIKEAAEMYAGCVSGAIQLEDYLQIIHNSGFDNIKVQKKKAILVPDEILLKYLTGPQLDAFKASGTGIFSITVYAEKPEGCGCGCNCNS